MGASPGYTLVELVTVIVILGILAAFAVPRFADHQVFEERGFYEEVVAALRYGQKIAVGSGCPVQISIDASGYALTQQTVLANRCDPGDSSYAVPILLPTGQAAAGTTPAGVTLGPVVTYKFDGLANRPGQRPDRQHWLLESDRAGSERLRPDAVTVAE